MRTKQTIKRLNMYRSFKAKRDEKGNIIRPAPFQSRLPSGTMSRVQPDRRWFGNTRVISQEALQNFKEVMKIRNPYEIVLRQTKLPISLLNEKHVKRKSDILASESFSFVFGKKAQRKRPRLAVDSINELASEVATRGQDYDLEKDANRCQDLAEFRDEASEPHFKAGRSKRIWNELFKVLDSSDVVLYVLDARDPIGTRSTYIENYLRTEKPHKHFIFVLNKVDLVPVWIIKQWKTILSRDYPTLIFHANMTKSLGKSALLGLLRQFARLHSKDRPQISVGIIGYPNVGKSSIINCLRSKKVCNVAPLAGETKVWQYVSLMKSIYLIDCPGVVYPKGDTEADLVMKAVVRVEYLKEPEMYIRNVLERVQAKYMQQQYALPKRTEESDWVNDWELFLELVSKQTGRLLKGGEADLSTTARRVLNDFQRGKLPYFVRPLLTPEDEEEFKAKGFVEETTNGEQPSATLQEADSMEEPVENDEEVDDQLTDEEDETLGKFDIAAGHLFDEEEQKNQETTSAKDSSITAAGAGLSSKKRRQLHRELMKLQNKSGQHYYAEVNVKNKKRKL